MIELSDYSGAILERLVEKDRLSPTACQAVISQMHETGHGIDQVLMSRGFVEEAELLQILSDVSGIPLLAQLHIEAIDSVKFHMFDVEFWNARAAIPLQSEGLTMQLAVSLPLSEDHFREISFLLQDELSIVLSPSQMLRQVIRLASEHAAYPAGDDSPSAMIAAPEMATSEDGLTARGVDVLVADAVAAGASDIHLDAVGTQLKARFRINGILRVHKGLQNLDALAVMARLKLKAGMSVTERRLPQDGSCKINHAGRTIELRLSSLPAQAGESMVCRVLDPKTTKLGWPDLGFSEDLTARLLSLVEQPYGLLIISGPTGSGKTTTLYTALRHLNDGTRKILTVEDPIEQTIEGVEQVQVNAPLGLTFGKVLRTTLRHDPDVLMIGEIRDEETAEIACRAALIGRLVLATIHASTAQLVRERFVNLGVAQYLADEVLLGVLSQRLVAVVCERCAGEGCVACDRSGRSGRMPEAELWVPER